ncbi:MAG: hypothetical protein AVDCRST_MAG49-2807, partial [uncultured Thermomicrobiales bacterium]
DRRGAGPVGVRRLGPGLRQSPPRSRGPPGHRRGGHGDARRRTRRHRAAGVPLSERRPSVRADARAAGLAAGPARGRAAFPCCTV